VRALVLKWHERWDSSDESSSDPDSSDESSSEE